MNMITTTSMVNDPSTNILTEDQIRVFAPNVFCEAPTNPEVSDRYTVARTIDVVRDMDKLNWGVITASQPARRNRRSISSYHMVEAYPKAGTVEPIQITREDGTVDTCFPRIILTNSHDGFNSFRFMVGLYRVVCGNGLIVATDSFSYLRIRHINYTFDELRGLINQIVEMVPSQTELINKMNGRILSIDEKRSLALAALRERRNDPEFEVSNVVLDNILTPVRDEDHYNDCWTTMNIIQEKMMTGGFDVPTKTGKVRKARQIKAIHKTISLSQAIFKEAVKFIA